MSEASGIDQLFERTRAENRAALVGYLPAGFPDLKTSIAAIEAMVESGVDLVEVGLPYSDPVMDGPVIQAAADRALVGGTRTSDVIDVVRASADTGAPTVVMTYWNPVERYGVHRFAADLADAGGAGLITPDLTPDDGLGMDATSPVTIDSFIEPSPHAAPATAHARRRRHSIRSRSRAGTSRAPSRR